MSRWPWIAVPLVAGLGLATCLLPEPKPPVAAPAPVGAPRVKVPAAVVVAAAPRVSLSAELRRAGWSPVASEGLQKLTSDWWGERE